MTAELALHLIEQFAAQAPFAVLVADSRGVAVFANRKLYEMFEIADHPSSVLGADLFSDPAIRRLNLAEMARRAERGEAVESVIEIQKPDALGSRLAIGRKSPLTLKAVCYPLRSSSQKIEHYVMVMSDITEACARRAAIRERALELSARATSREKRRLILEGLRREAAEFAEDIRGLGATPSAG